VIHVRVGQKNRVDWWQIGDAEAWAALPPEHDESRGKDRVDEERLAGGLYQE
jgi:hypothetical protein